MKETSKLRFLTRREQGRTRGHSDVKSANFPKKLFLNKKQFICFILSLYIYLRYFRTRLFGGYLNVTLFGGKGVISGNCYLCSLTNTIAGLPSFV